MILHRSYQGHSLPIALSALGVLSSPSLPLLRRPSSSSVSTKDESSALVRVGPHGSALKPSVPPSRAKVFCDRTMRGEFLTTRWGQSRGEQVVC